VIWEITPYVTYKFIYWVICMYKQLNFVMRVLPNTLNCAYNDYLKHTVIIIIVLKIYLKVEREWRCDTRNSWREYAATSCSKTGFDGQLKRCVLKPIKTFGIKSTESNQTYGKFSACQFSRRFSKVRKVLRSTLIKL
jgi:hypothetical protein